MNDLVKVNVKNLTGKKLTKLTYTYSVDGRTYEKEIVVVDSSSAAEKVFCFYMPDAQIVTVHATFADDPTNTAAQPVQNGRGKSVGVGAAFAFTYGNTTTEAGIASNRTLETGTLEIRADADRKVETGSVSGTDPLESGNPQGEAAAKNKDVALDASVAVNALTGSVRTFAGNGTNITDTGCKYRILLDHQDGTSVGIATPLRPAAASPRYDLSGRRIAEPAEPGIYIMNGKKVIVK